MATLKTDDDVMDVDNEEGPFGVVLEVSLGSSRRAGSHGPSAAEAECSSGALAWCAQRNIIALASSSAVSLSRTRTGGATYYVPIHLVDPQRPAEHILLRSPADAASVSMEHLAWSPPSAGGALHALDSSGHARVWTQPRQRVSPGVARAGNRWQCEHEWSQGPAVFSTWLQGPSAYAWPAHASKGGSCSYEERFYSRKPRSPRRWPRGEFLCICTVFASGALQLRWRQPVSDQPPSASWHATQLSYLACGPAGLLLADAAVTTGGQLIVVGVPANQPSTVCVWEVKPASNQPLGGVPVEQGWPGMAPVPAMLIAWNSKKSGGAKGREGGTDRALGRGAGPLLAWESLSYLIALDKKGGGPGEGGRNTSLSPSLLPPGGSNQRLAAIAVDPTKPASCLVTLCVSDTVGDSTGISSSSSYRVVKWGATQQLRAVHPLFGTNAAAAHANASASSVTTWVPLAARTFCLPGNPGQAVDGGSVGGARSSFLPGHLGAQRSRGEHVKFSLLGSEVAVSLPTGQVHLLAASDFSILRSYDLQGGAGLVVDGRVADGGSRGNRATPVAFSPAACCLAASWQDEGTRESLLQILRVPIPEPLEGSTEDGASLWERHLADRVEWSWVTKQPCWDAVACVRSAAHDGFGSVAGVLALLDADFHALPLLAQRQHYSPVLDRVKCALLEGCESSEARAFVLDMQARLLLDHLGRAVEGSLVVPTLPTPWTGTNEAMSQLGPDALAAELPLAVADAVLDLASYFLTRLRRYFGLYKTIVTAGGTSPASPALSAANNGATPVQSVAKSAHAKAAAGRSPPTPPEAAPSGSLQQSVGASAFPGMPGVRLMSDRHFLHRLCQLVFFTLVFRRRSPPPPAAGTGGNGVQRAPSDASGGSNGNARGPGARGGEDRSMRLGGGNGGNGYSPDEVKALFLVVTEICRKTLPMPATFPAPLQQQRAAGDVTGAGGGAGAYDVLHYPDGQLHVAPEAIESWLSGPDAAGFLMHELELQPPAEELTRKGIGAVGPPAASSSLLSPPPGSAALWDDGARSVCEEEDDEGDRRRAGPAEWEPIGTGPGTMWPRKRRFAERNAALGLATSLGMDKYFGFVGARRDMLTASWRLSPDATWHKCAHCRRQTAALKAHASGAPAASKALLPADTPEAAVPAAGALRGDWWPSRWAHGCPICGGYWLQMPSC
eukprot:jgi/Mesen1/8341/ME000461S07756